MTRNNRLFHSCVLLAALSLLAVWSTTHIHQLTAAPNTLIRFVLTAAFALLLVLRPKPSAAARPLSIGLLLPTALLGVALHLTGLVLDVKQAEWIGLLLVVAASLGWALPGHYARDSIKALFLLYWAHPLPSQFLNSLQLTMQQASVTGAEWLLHIFNVRVWADGLVLKTGLHIFEVPAWCSGMRTATTVFILALGLGLIKRLALHQKILAVAAALLQALALNIIRITVMVALVPRLPDVDSITYLHDTAGLIVLIAVLLVYIEIEFMRHAKHKADARASELTPDLDTILRDHPPFWRNVADHPGRIVAGTLVLLLTVLAGYKLRSHHRLEMYRGVTESLRDAGYLADAERLGWQVQAMQPADAQWESAMLRLLVMRGKYRAALDRLDSLPDTDPDAALEHQILRAYALMGLDRQAEARQLIDRMPAKIRDNDPRIAMILAEMSFYANDAEDVARHVVTAARWGPNIDRIRALYPYLRTARKWDVIVATDPRTGYGDPAQAFAAAEAFMNRDRVLDVAVLARHTVQSWPKDPRLLVPLFYMAGKRPDEGWIERYAAHLRRCLPAMDDPDALYNIVEDTFHLRRPDLAWSIYRRIQEIAPDYPGLGMMAVRYGTYWFAFRKRYLGMASSHPWETVNLAPYFHIGRLTPIWASICDTVPLGSELSVADTVPVRKAMLQRGLDRFAALYADDTLSLTMIYEYAFALEIDKQIEKAKAVLQGIASQHPDQAESARIAISAMYERAADWQNVYETLRTYPDDVPHPRLTAMLRLTKAQLNLQLGLGALRTAERAVQHHPDSGEAAGALSLARGSYDSPEASLQVLSRDILFHTPDLDMLEAEALLRTQRFQAYRELKDQSLLSAPPVQPDANQVYSLPPAELALNWHLVFIPSEEVFARHADRIRANLPRTTSPFLRDLYTLWLACYSDDAPDTLLRPESWIACGRDVTEQSIALSQLYILLCRSQDYTAAQAAAEAAVAIDPAMALHWRYLVGLSHGQPTTIARARAACPRDPEIWLAWLLSHCREGLADPHNPPSRPDITAAIDTAVAQKTFTAATLTRAAELLLRAGYHDAAITASRSATREARTLLPVYVIGLRCAILAGDRAWAEQCTLNAVHAALQPPPQLYKMLVGIKVDDGRIDTDNDMVEALKHLRRQDPDNPLWARMLSFVRFKRGGWEVLDSLNQATAALTAGATDRTVYIVGAEAARLLQNTSRAVDLLQQGLERYPGDTVMLNNLAYTLADSPRYAAQALELVPELLTRSANTPWLIDTIALVYLRNDRLKEAEQALGWITDLPEPGSPDYFRMQLRKAEIAFRRDNLRKCTTLLRAILKGSKGISDEDILSANRLLSKADETLRQLEQAPVSASDEPPAAPPAER